VIPLRTIKEEGDVKLTEGRAPLNNQHNPQTTNTHVVICPKSLIVGTKPNTQHMAISVVLQNLAHAFYSALAST
jgi:hypothetical protein